MDDVGRKKVCLYSRLSVIEFATQVKVTEEVPEEVFPSGFSVGCLGDLNHQHKEGEETMAFHGFATDLFSEWNLR